MPDLLAKGTAVAVAVLLALSVGILFYTSQPTNSGAQITAEFDDAFPLIEGMYVRVDGAIAGSVGKIEVNDRGNAEVKLNLNDSIEPPMADATAAIRQQDTTGDSYIAFDPGGDSETAAASEPLGEDGIVCESADECGQTLVAPRLDDLLNAFGPPERAGVQLILVELSKSLDSRGADLNKAALTLRPAIESADQALDEVNQQNSALKSLISSAENVTGQAARRDREVGNLVDSLATTLSTTASQSAALDAGLERLPETTAQLRTTLASLTRSAIAAKPLAEETAAGAPQLATAIGALPGFLDNASGFLNETRPVLDLTRKVLKAAEPSLRIGKKRVITGAFDLTGAVAELLNAVLGGEDAFPALFGDDSYGVGEGTLGKRGFGAVAVEPGDLPGYPAGHADRNWLRVSGVINCEVFGVKVEPGCLADVLAGGGGLPLPLPKRADSAIEGRSNGFGLGNGSAGRPGSGGGGGEGPGSGGEGSGPRGGNLPDLPGLGLPDLGLGLGKGESKRAGGGKNNGKAAKQGLDKRLGGAGDLLDFLLGN